MAKNTAPKKESDYLVRMGKHRDEAKDRAFYSIQRIDLLLISLSGGGLYIVFETLKFIREEEFVISTNPLKWSGGFFVAAILCNFISQWTGYATNNHEAEWAKLEEDLERDGECDETQKGRHDTLASLYTWWTQRLNIASTIAMLCGVGVVLWFYLTSL